MRGRDSLVGAELAQPSSVAAPDRGRGAVAMILIGLAAMVGHVIHDERKAGR